MKPISMIENSSWTHVVLPSQWVGLLINACPREFRLRLGADTDKTTEFWRGFFHSPLRRRAANAHPFLAGKTPTDLAHAIPCAVHEDAGPISKQLSGNCLSWSSMLGVGPEKLTKFIMATSVKQNTTDQAAWSAILEDFDMLALGADMARDSHGTRW